MKTSKEDIKALIEAVAANPKWPDGVTSQRTVKMATAIWLLDAAGLKQGDKVRNEILAAFLNTPSGFGCNASQLLQDLGLRAESKKREAASTEGF